MTSNYEIKSSQIVHHLGNGSPLLFPMVGCNQRFCSTISLCQLMSFQFFVVDDLFCCLLLGMGVFLVVVSLKVHKIGKICDDVTM